MLQQEYDERHLKPQEILLLQSLSTFSHRRRGTQQIRMRLPFSISFVKSVTFICYNNEIIRIRVKNE